MEIAVGIKRSYGSTSIPLAAGIILGKIAMREDRTTAIASAERTV